MSKLEKYKEMLKSENLDPKLEKSLRKKVMILESKKEVLK